MRLLSPNGVPIWTSSGPTTLDLKYVLRRISRTRIYLASRSKNYLISRHTQIHERVFTLQFEMDQPIEAPEGSAQNKQLPQDPQPAAETSVSKPESKTEPGQSESGPTGAGAKKKRWGRDKGRDGARGKSKGRDLGRTKWR